MYEFAIGLPRSWVTWMLQSSLKMENQGRPDELRKKRSSASEQTHTAMFEVKAWKDQKVTFK